MAVYQKRFRPRIDGIYADSSRPIIMRLHIAISSSEPLKPRYSTSSRDHDWGTPRGRIACCALSKRSSGIGRVLRPPSKNTVATVRINGCFGRNMPAGGPEIAVA